MVKKKYARLAAALAALIITGAGWMPAQAAYHEWSTDNQDRGNLQYEFTENSSPSLSRAYRNVFIGDSWMVESAEDNFLYGNGGDITYNLQWVNDSVVFGDNVKLTGTSSTERLTNALVFGDNVSLRTANTGTIIGDNNYVSKADNTLIIGDGVEIVSGKVGEERLDSTTVIGNDVHIGSQEHVAAAAGDNITVIGDHVNVDNTKNRTNSSNSLIYGNNVTMTNSQNSVAMGNEISMTGTGNENDDNVAIGHGISLGQTGGGHSTGTVAMGDHINVNGTDNVVIGGDIDLSNHTTTAAVVLGYKAKTDGDQSVSIGEGASSGTSGVAVGGESLATENAAAFGFQAVAKKGETTVIGPYSMVDSSYSAALGDSVRIGSTSEGSVSIGGHSAVGNNSKYAIAIGGSGGGHGDADEWTEARTTIGNNAKASIAMGYGASIADDTGDSIALGTGASVDAAVTNPAEISLGTTGSGIAIGKNSAVTAKFGTAIGRSAEASGVSSIAFGDGAKASSQSGIAIGEKAQVDSKYSVAIGSSSKVTADDIFTTADLAAFKAQLGEDYDATYNITAADFSNRGVFSVGSAGGERRIINVARGRISADSTDAVNGSQLYGAVKYLEGKIDAAGGGGDVSIDGDENITVTGPTDTTPTTPGTGEGGGTTGGEGGTTVPGGETGGGTNPGGETGGEGGTTGGGTTEPGGGSTGGTTGGAGSGSEGQNFTVNMSDNPVFGGHDDGAPGHAADGSVVVTGSNGANRVAINENNEGGMTVTSKGHTVNINKGGDGLVNGLINTEWDWGKYEEGGYKDSSNAATESQLHELVGGIEQDITNMGDQITNLGGEVNRLSGRIDEVGAGAAALAALHPLDFDPDEKWDFAAGYGHYRGENAVAIGAFYRPNEDTMFSIGGTVGNGDEMINAGVSFKIGQGNHVSTSRVAMAKEIIELRKDLEDLRSAMAGGVTGQTLDLSKIQLFPDTPDNHWAYDYVATLAGNGILEGYPDGYFNGDRPITRYEMAAVLYRAMQKGVRLSDRALREFAPELDRIRVDTITKDEQGMPEIQRVRVVKGRE